MASLLSEQEKLLLFAKDVGSVVDSNQFCFRVLRDVVERLHADRCSLFLARDDMSGSGKELASKLWNVTPQSTYEEVLCDARNEFVLPFGVGIAGHSAISKEMINVANVQEDDRFSQSIDEKTGYSTRSILCHPIITPEDGKVVAVVNVLNKKNNKKFTEEDEKTLGHFIVLCSLAIQHTKRSAMIARLNKVAELQKELSSDVAKIWMKRNYDDLLKEILLKISKLFECERYTLAVSLKGSYCSDLRFTKSYDLMKKKPTDSGAYLDVQSPEKIIEITKLKKSDWIFSHKVVEMALDSEKLVNLSKIHPFSPYKLEDEKRSFSLKTVLCLPFYDSTKRLLGLIHLANKRSGFTEDDENILQSVCPYITNALLFANSFHSITQNKANNEISQEMMLYHAQCTEDEFDVIKHKSVPTSESLNLYDFKFSELSLSEDDTILAAMRIFIDMDVFSKFKVAEDTILRWLLNVRKCYRPVAYHNWRHGFNVAHMMFLLQDRLSKESEDTHINNIFTDLEKFALISACFCHDVDHRGTNNAFLIRGGEPLAVLYNTSTLENHHYRTCMQLSNVEGSRIFDGLNDEQYTHTCNVMKHAILSTDLALYFQRRNSFKELLEQNQEERDFHKFDNKMLLMSMMMTACDLSSVTKTWEVQRKMANLVTSEFYDQGDQEKSLFGTEPIAMMDRRKIRELPKMQIGFIDGVCSLVYQMMADFCPSYNPLRESMLSNRAEWQEVAKREGIYDDEVQEAKPEPPEFYVNEWEKYWQADPENFIWGIDPNEAPPEVVIERVVFSPKKKNKSPPVRSNGDKKIGNGKSLSKRMSRKNKGDRQHRADEAGRSSKKSSTSASSTDSNTSKNSKLCIIMCGFLKSK